jgi:hypothetical protein
VSYVNRARAFMPAGTVPPFVMRFDAGSVPVGRPRILAFPGENAGTLVVDAIAPKRHRGEHAVVIYTGTDPASLAHSGRSGGRSGMPVPTEPSAPF